jgi:AraC-like DNA-binding protein
MHAFRDALRLRTSINHLAESNSSLASIALDLGYSSQSHFSDSFRRHFGVAPGRARELVLHGTNLKELTHAAR